MAMEKSIRIKRAKSQLESIKGHPLSLEERKKLAISLAALMLEEAQDIQLPKEKKYQAEIAGMMQDGVGKVFITMITDQCFRSKRTQRVADQIIYLIKSLGIPHYLPLSKKLLLQALVIFGKIFPNIAIPLFIRTIRKETRHVILPGEEKILMKHIQQRQNEGVRINLNRLGEAILGEEEARQRLQIYLNDLSNPEVEYISIKISTIYSQINLLAWQDTLDLLSNRLRQLYRAAMKHRYIDPNGISIPKFVNLDMEEYRDLHLTVALFRQVLDEPEFYQYKAGIVLQAYLPDSFLIQEELTNWAIQRCIQGGAPIKIRLVKGANLSMEQFESALHLWPQAPYPSKLEVDANYKRMITYGCQKQHAKAVHIGIGSHNLFDIAYALLLRSENEVEKEVSFEMLEGMADHIRRVVQQLSGEILLYCPAATKEEFQNAIAYLVRRLDENTAPENFLRQIFELQPNTPAWEQQIKLFSDACLSSHHLSYLPRRTQNRLIEKPATQPTPCFNNEPDTDWSLPQNCKWAKEILKKWKQKNHPPIPLAITGMKVITNKLKVGEDPFYPGQTLYQYSIATQTQAEEAIESAKKAETMWARTSLSERMTLISNIANELRLHRADLIGAMVADTGKTILEADSEVSEAIDFAEYYRINIEEWHHLTDIHWKPKGTILVASPWNFPCSIPAGGILAALITGNCVIFKPANEAVLVGWYLVQLFWKAGISPHVLQFITCEDDPVGSHLIKDPRLSAIVLTGSTATAKLFLQLCVNTELIAETGGKNTMVISAMSDRDLAIKDLIQSAFGHAGQKCSACSLAILEAEVYDDKHFLQQLRDATASLTVGSSWDLNTKVNPLIRFPDPTLMKGLTILEPGEEWLLEPKQDPNCSNLWSPGIKMGVKPSSFTFQNELFGPVLGLVRADSIEHAFTLMNQTPYGLTAGLHSLDEREQKTWLNRIEAGNCYVNRTMTGAIVERQPFGGCKDSSFGKGAKAGGPNYLVQFMQTEQTDFPLEKAPLNSQVRLLAKAVKQSSIIFETQLEVWQASLGSYAFYWNEYFSKMHDPSLVLGQDNFQCYRTHSSITLRAQCEDSVLDILRTIAAALTCRAKLEVSLEDEKIASQLKRLGTFNLLTIRQETNEIFAQSLKEGKIKRIRLFKKIPVSLQIALAKSACHLNIGPVMANGRLELLHFLREVSISYDYHRYGNLGKRSQEKRHSLPGSLEEKKFKACEACTCL